MGKHLPVFVGEAPDFEARGDHMFARWRGIEIALPIDVYVQSVLMCEEALAKWHLARMACDNVVHLKGRRKR